MKKSTAKGFTLIEIMIALAILAISLLSLYTAQGNSLKASGHAERIRIASQLAKNVMTEKVFDLQKDMDKGLFPEEKVDEKGKFDAPYEDYEWEFIVSQIELPMAAEAEAPQEDKSKTGQNLNNADNVQVSETTQRSLGQIVSKKINESVREVQVKVIWEELGEEQSVLITTHIAKL